ncbi:hypothetical protein [Treponema maltophilum]|uniref:Lipoprotein n=1 Tax=Treponema maltophilum ATCC 51939 TaxID=1125699 RepID=S3K0W5_TREMA|nr:hypothetical protein [Treponema maltophilum]EPF30536.1 hypothetical protein HMPREF9194_00853 [Treponema maltophilum ATCC 51939]
MKKIYLFFFAFLAFTSCIMNPSYLKKNYTFTNESSQKVSFSLPGYGSEIYTLQQNEKITKHIYSQPEIHFLKDFRTLYYERFVTETVIKDKPSWDLQIINLSDKKLVITEKDRNMGYFDDNGNMSPLEIEANTTKNTKLFSITPVFLIQFVPDSGYSPLSKLEKDKDSFKLFIYP